MAQHAVGAPFLGQLHHGAGQVAVVLLQLGFEAGEQSEGVGRGAGESGDDLAVIQAAQLLGGGFEDFRAERHLPVAGHHHFAVAADAEDGGGADSSLFRHESPVWHSGAAAERIRDNDWGDAIMRACLAFLGTVLCVALPLLAHHSFSAEFDATKSITPSGVVTRVAWAKPHVYFLVDVKDAYLAKDGSKFVDARLVKLPDGRKVFAGSSDDGGPTK